MKKSFFVLLLPLLASSLAGCVKYNGKPKDGGKGTTTTTTTTTTTPPDTNPPTSEPVPVEPGSDVTYYLNLGRYGKLDGNPGTVQADVFLEYGVKISGKSGDALPTKDNVTSDQFGVVFEGWLLNGTQDAYTQVPNINYCVLVAVYSGSGEGGGGGGAVTDRTTNFPSTGYGFKFTTGEGYVASYFGPDEYREGSTQYQIKNAHFVKGETFSLIDFSNSATWADPLDPYSLGGSSPESTNWQAYLSKNDTSSYTVLQDFSSAEIYLKMKYEDNIIYFSL